MCAESKFKRILLEFKRIKNEYQIGSQLLHFDYYRLLLTM